MEAKKTKRIKRVFSNPGDVLHLWANQSQSDARSKNCYFEGTSCYSYGQHYELGRLVQFKGKTVALMNAKGYSHTTSSHISYAWGAVSHLLRIKCVGTWDIREALVQTQGALVTNLMSFFSQRAFYAKYNPFEKNSWLQGELNEFNKLCTELGFKELRLDPTEDYIGLVRAHIGKCVARQAELKNERATPEYQAKQEALKLKKYGNEVTKWRLGGQATNYVRSIRPMILRVDRINGQTVQTSSGASVALSEALTLLRRIESGVAKDGDKIGSYTMDKVNVDEYGDGMVKIGCHTISIAEAKAVLGEVKTLKLVG